MVIHNSFGTSKKLSIKCFDSQADKNKPLPEKGRGK